MPPDDTMLPGDYEINDGDNSDYSEMIMVKESVIRMMVLLEEARLMMIKVATDGSLQAF